MKVLRPILGEASKTKKVKPVNFATADIEVHEWTHFLCIGFYDGHNKVYKWFSNLLDFLEFVFEHCYEKDISSIFCHFGGKFDFNFILQAVCFSKEYTFDTLIPRGSGMLCFDCYKEGLRVKNGKKRFKITFRDSSALLPFALRTLAESFNVPIKKGDVDYLFLGHAFNNKNYVNELLKNPNRYTVYYKGKEITKFCKSYSLSLITYFDKQEEKIHKHYNKDDVLDYLERDCKAQWQCIDVFYQWPLVQKAGLCFTTASQAVKIWQTFLKKPIYSIPTTVDRFVRHGYMGGRTEVFRPFFDSKYDIKKNPHKLSTRALSELKKQKDKKLYYIDVNSLYPTVMKSNVFPNKFKCWAFAESYSPKSLGFWDIDIFVPEMFCPPLGVKHKFEDGTEKFIFPTGTFRGTWTTQEIEYAKSLGCKVLKIYRGALFESGGHMFKDFVEELYAIRLMAKKTNDKTSNMLAKLIMNSCYGRLGLNILRSNLVIDEGQLGLKPHSEIRNGDDVIRFAEKPVALTSSFTNVAISAYVTAYSRILMHKEVYLPSGEEHLYYTDTDSAFTTQYLKYFSIGDELGELKNEYEILDEKGRKIDEGYCESACFLLPKGYHNEGIHDTKMNTKGIVSKSVLKGFDKKKIQSFTFDDYTLAALKGELDRLKVHQGPKFATLKTALNKGRFVAMNFDPERQKMYDQEDLKKNQMDLLKAIDPNEIQYLQQQIKKLKKKLYKNDYKSSERAVKSVYDKRVIIKEGFATRPINLQ